ncbi:MAG: hypothetical protein IPO03_01455 [Bacteroidetes bacterium]|nr:hypothetical protein [Bacteroidota bacterium]
MRECINLWDQKVYALDAGPEGPNHPNDKYFVVRKVANEQSWNVEQEMVIVVPIKNEKLKLLEGVITGIPHNCLIIVVSNSDRDDVDRFNMEKNVVENICHFSKRDFLIVHQKDPEIAELFESMGYADILGEDGLIRDGKSEGCLLAFYSHNYFKKIYWFY